MPRRLHLLLLALAVLGALSCPPAARAQTAVFTTNTAISDTNLAYEGQDIVVQGCTLTVSGVHSFNSLTLQRSAANQPAILTHPAGFVNAQVAGFHLTIATTASVEGAATGGLVASRIDADGRGYASSAGPGLGAAPGTGVCCGRGGSGHGGPGAPGNTFAGGPSYDNDAAPVMLGSGGTPRFAGSNAGAGGGAIRLSVGGVLTVNGLITASAASCAGDNGGAAGGTIRLLAPTIAGSGQITARGGTNTSAASGGGGAGGRIALNSCQLQINLSLVSASGGTGFQPGSPGSIFLGSSSIAVTQHPAPQTHLDGETATLSVVATGSGPLTYQWRRNNNPLSEDGRITGLGTETIQIPQLSPADSGTYDVVLFDTCGPDASNPAPVEVFCHADWDHNRLIQPADISAMVQSWYAGLTGGTLSGDYNGDASVDPADIAAFVQVWFATLTAGGC